jgi:hypothetical protein
MATLTINLNEKTIKRFSKTNLEKFINSEDFEDLVLWYHMIKWQTWKTQSFSSFKDELWL